MKNTKKKVKNISKKIFISLLVIAMVVVQLPLTIFADETAVTEEVIDNIIKEGIVASNEAMAKGGSYAVLSDLDENNTVTVNMYNDNYQIVKGNRQGGVYEDIINVLIEKLSANKDKVSKIEAVTEDGSSVDNASITLDYSQVDANKVVTFILGLGLKGANGEGLNPTGGIGQLNGQSFKVKVTAKNNEEVAPIYTVKFNSVKVTDTVIDDIIRDGIKASNAAMNNDGNPYAQLSDLDENRNITVKMYDPSYAIKGTNGEDVYGDIIEVLVNKLYENREKVATIAAVNDSTDAGTIKLSDLTGVNDNSKIVQFILKLGLKGKDQSALNPTEGIGQLDGQSFSVIVTGNDNETTATYTVTFKTWKELELTPEAEGENDSNLKLEVTEDSKTLTGTDLVNKDKASGSTVTEIKEKFTNVAEGLTLEIVNNEGQKLDDSAAVGTGSKIKLLNGDQVVDEIVIVVSGDVDGDGSINVADAVNMLNSISKINKLSGVYEEASHVTGNSVLTVADVVGVLDITTNAKKN